MYTDKTPPSGLHMLDTPISLQRPRVNPVIDLMANDLAHCLNENLPALLSLVHQMVSVWS